MESFRYLAALLLAPLLCGTALRPCSGAEPRPATRPNAEVAPAANSGGMPCWSDVLFFGHWHIQRHMLQGTCRLLDDKDRCQATGTWQHCQQVLEQAKRREHLGPMPSRVVLLLHGLFRSRSCMSPLADYLNQQGGYLVLNVEYPSTQSEVADHARSLASIVQHLEGVEEIHLVGHSLGNIIIRRWLADRGPQDPPGEPRLGRIVMLGPPNQGAQLATMVARQPIFRRWAGPAGQQLGPEWPWLALTLATPPGEFAIIAGGLDNEHGFNPLLPGDNDGTVTVESTRLEGAQDFLILPVLHSMMMRDKRVQQQTLLFLQQGHFEHPGE